MLVYLLYRRHRLPRIAIEGAADEAHSIPPLGAIAFPRFLHDRDS